MKTFPQKIIVPVLVVLAILLLSVRPAHAVQATSQQVSVAISFSLTFPYPYGNVTATCLAGEQVGACVSRRAAVLGYSITGLSYSGSGFVSMSGVLNGSIASTNGWVDGLSTSTTYVCPANSGNLQGQTCTCSTGYQPNTAGTACEQIPCSDKAGTESPHLTADGATVPDVVCSDSCAVNIEVGASNGTLWVGWGTYSGQSCSGQQSASPTPAPDPDVCPAGKTIYQGVCTPLVDIPELGYGGMSLNDIQKAIAKSEAAAKAQQKANDALADPQYVSPSSVPPAPTIQTGDKKKIVEQGGTTQRDAARDQGGDGNTQIIAGALGSGFASLTATLNNIFGGGISGASIHEPSLENGLQPETKTIAVSQITPVTITHAQAVCPSTQITLQGRPATWTYNTECEFAARIRPILLTFAWLAAAGILIGGIRNG